MLSYQPFLQGAAVVCFVIEFRLAGFQSWNKGERVFLPGLQSGLSCPQPSDRRQEHDARRYGK
jgi:hypothetical protein